MCYEFDVATAAKHHADLMFDRHGAPHESGHNMTKAEAEKLDQMKENRTLKNWETLRFVIGHNKSGNSRKDSYLPYITPYATLSCFYDL